MNKMYEYKTILSEHKNELRKKYNIKKIGIFGSYARGEESVESDIDILVEFNKPIGLDFVTLADEIETMLGHQVDLVSTGAVSPKMMKYIKEELISV